MRSSLLVGVCMLLASGCAGSPPPTEEDLALRACVAELRQQLHVSSDDAPAQTLMIGKRDYGWLIRGLSRKVSTLGPQNYECRLDDPPSGPPTLTYLRLCAPGESPWGCPTTSPS